MDRRAFLGAAAAVAALPSTAGGETDGGDLGSAVERFPTRGDVWSAVEFRQHGFDENADLVVVGQWFDDEPGYVEVNFSNQFARLTVAIDPDEARGLARDLLEAADHAEEGAD